MFDRQFLSSKLGQAAIASVLAMIALTTQFAGLPGSMTAAVSPVAAVEMA